MYELIYSDVNGTVIGIKRLADKAFIPLDEDSSSYQAFLVWNAEQAEPLDLGSISQEMIDANTAHETMIAAREQVIIDNLPSWSQVSTAVDNISNLAEAKTFLKKLALVVYWLAKNTDY